MRILVIRFSSLGDVVLATGPLHALLAAIPSLELTFITKPGYEPLLRHLPPSLIVPRLDSDRPLLSAWKVLRGRTFDWIIDLHGSLRSVALTHLLRSKRQTRVKKNARLRRDMVRHKRGLSHPLSTLSVYHDALMPLGLDPPRSRPRLELSPAERDRVRQIRSTSPATLGVGWGARWPTKAVPEDLWRHLFAQIPETNPRRVAIFGPPGDTAALETFASSARAQQPGRIFDVIASDDWREVMVNLAVCSAYVGSDSGLMHVADALAVPTFGLFGPTHPALGFPPSGPDSRAFHAGTWCSPCHRHGAAPCFRGHRYCFDELDQAAVAAAIATALAGPQDAE